MITAEGLVTAFSRNASYVHAHLDGLSHAEALLQPPARGNCILWIMGHIVCYRNYILDALGEPPALPESQAARFARGSAPVLADEPGLAQLQTLLEAFDQAQERLAAGLRRLTPEQAAQVITQRDFTLPRAELVMSYMRHESYHAGQFELLREIVLSRRG